MGRTLYTAISIIVFLFASNFAGAAASQAWRSKMAELSKALQDTIPYLYPDPGQDEKQLTEKVKRIYDITKTLDGKLNHATLPDSDPALPYIAGLLKEDIERAYQSLKEGHTEYAKGVIRNSAAYCIACHTRTRGGAEFPLITAFAEPLKRSSWVERIEFQAATRQFDTVIEDVMNKLQKPSGNDISSLDLERAARVALAIAVRTKQDPEIARALSVAIKKSKSSTYTMTESAKVWIADIAEWEKERNKKYASNKEMIEAARKLTEKASQYSEVKYLRASVLMHDLLKKPLEDKESAEALYLIGLSYDPLKELGLWSLHEAYFLSCIKKVPHSDLAQRCYDRYAESITLGYTGSSGVHVPKTVRIHLDQMRALARAKATM